MEKPQKGKIWHCSQEMEEAYREGACRLVWIHPSDKSLALRGPAKGKQKGADGPKTQQINGSQTSAAAVSQPEDQGCCFDENERVDRETPMASDGRLYVKRPPEVFTYDP
jgi:hypothetical protein